MGFLSGKHTCKIIRMWVTLMYNPPLYFEFHQLNDNSRVIVLMDARVKTSSADLIINQYWY